MKNNIKLRVCYVLSYRSPDYIRTQSILSALNSIEEIELKTIINTSAGLGRYPETLGAAFRLAKENWADIYILGFRGHEIYWPLRMIAGSTPIIFDAMMSPYAALTEESKHGLSGKIIARLIGAIEKSILTNAKAILTDTAQHSHYLCKQFNIPANKIYPIPVGAIERIQPPMGKGGHKNNKFSVLFYGSFLPLHGVPTIIESAQRLTDLPLQFDFIGGGKEASKTLARSFPCSDLLHYTHQEWMPFDDLINHQIPLADICLGGPFGNTPQAIRVVTGKTSQCLAAGKLTIIGKINDDYGFVNQSNCLLVEQGNPDDLAAAIRWAFHHQDQLNEIGKNGKELYDRTLSISVIHKSLKEILTNIHPIR